MRAGHLLDRPITSTDLGRVTSPIEIDTALQQSLLLLTQRPIVEIGLTSRITSAAVAVDLHILEPPRHHLAAPVDHAAIRDGMVEEDQQPRLHGRLLGVDQNRTPPKSLSMVLGDFAKHGR